VWLHGWLLSLPPTFGKPLPTAPERHPHAHRRKKKNPALRVAAIAAPVLTLGVIGVGVADAGLTSHPPVPASALHNTIATIDMTRAANRVAPVTRSADRMAQVALGGESKLTKLTRFTTTDLNLRTAPQAKAHVLTVLKPGTKVIATGIRYAGYAQLLRGTDYLWVTASYLSTTKPDPASASPATMGLSLAPCPDDSVENGLTPGAVRVHRAVCHAFPDITTYGGWAPRGEHADGKAIDVMHPSVAEGYRIAEFLQAHAAQLDLYDIIWRQHIWTPVRASEGWRMMPDRGSPTANHYDHVHVAVN
jgi:hypothetical protein